MSELYENLLNRYKNSSYWKDDNNVMGVILFNEDPFTIKKMLVTFKYSSPDNKLDLVKFVTDALNKGFDWKLFGKPEWEAIEPKKKKPFMKPKNKFIQGMVSSKIENNTPLLDEILNNSALSISCIPNLIHRDVHIRSIADTFGFSYDKIKELVNNHLKNKHESISSK